MTELRLQAQMNKWRIEDEEVKLGEESDRHRRKELQRLASPRLVLD